MKLEFPTLQLAEWLIHGVTVIISLLQVDSVNDRTLRPIPRARAMWEQVGNIQGPADIFFAPDSPLCPAHRPPLTFTSK